MLSFLKNHPFAVEAYFDQSIVFTYAVPKEELVSLIPDKFELDTLNDSWGFIAVAMVKTKSLRPKGFPAFLGNDFFLIGYRIFVRYTSTVGKRLRGLYILGSATDKMKMSYFGNLFSHYNYSKIDINENFKNDVTELYSKAGDFKVKMDLAGNDAQLPPASPFKDWKEAMKFAGPLPFTLTYKKEAKEVLIVEGVRQNWIPRPVKVFEERFSFIEKLNLKGIVLANTFVIEQIPYYWKKGRVEKWD